MSFIFIMERYATEPYPTPIPIISSSSPPLPPHPHIIQKRYENISEAESDNIYVSDGDTSETKKRIVVESWTTEKESLLIEWRTALWDKNNIHNSISSKYRSRYKKQSLLLILLPLFMTIIQGIFIYLQTTSEKSTLVYDAATNTTHLINTSYEPITNLINVFAFALITALTYIIKTGDSGTRSANSNQHAVRCMDAVNKIDLELSRARNYRSVADLFMLEIRFLINQLQMSETFIVG
jgi:hypothetical protein